MEAPLWILIIYSSIGIIDGIYNHLCRYCLYAHASSFTEHLSHTFLSLGLALTVIMLVFVATVVKHLVASVVGEAQASLLVWR